MISILKDEIAIHFLKKSWGCEGIFEETKLDCEESIFFVLPIQYDVGITCCNVALFEPMVDQAWYVQTDRTSTEIERPLSVGGGGLILRPQLWE